MHMKKRWIAAVVLALAAALSLGGCSSSGSATKHSPAGSASTSGGTSSSDTSGVSAAAALLAAHSSGKAGDGPTAAQEPKSIATGKNVWYISCGSSIDPCRNAGAAIQAAGKVLGWKVTVFDGKLNPATWNAGITQATVAGADAIITGAIDCPAVSQSLSAAKAKGILTVSIFSYDCNDSAFGAGGKPLYDDIVQSGPTGTMDQTGLLAGELEAAWAIKDSGGKANVLMFSETDQAILAYIGKGFAQEMKTCSGCKIVKTVTFSITDIGPNLVQKARTALIQSPNADYAVAPNDTSALFLNQAISQAGKASKVKVLGTLGDEANIETIRGGGPQEMTVGFDTAWNGWASMDDLVHLFAKATPVYSGFTLGIVDKDNLPTGKVYVGPVDYTTNYPKAWGKS